VGPVLVIEVLELPQRVQEAALIPDERAVQEFAPRILRPDFYRVSAYLPGVRGLLLVHDGAGNRPGLG
jgi:hypothetical protein